jgi:4-hydroxy-3-polyprenylbenzoate decarboxylase
LDYSGGGLNSGSKVVLAAVGMPRRALLNELPPEFALPEGCREAKICMPGVLAVTSPRHRSFDNASDDFAEHGIPLVVLVDDADFSAKTLNNFLGVTFTRSNPAADIYGAKSTSHNKHWGCQPPLIIDARIKAHHAPPLEVDAKTSSRIDALAAQGGPLAKYL